MKHLDAAGMRFVMMEKQTTEAMTLRQKNYNQNIKDRLFDAAWILFLTALILNLTAWNGLDQTGHVGQILRVMRFAALALFCVVILWNLFTRQYCAKWIFFYVLLAVVFGLSWYFSKERTLLNYFLVFAAAFQQDARRLAALAAAINGAILFLNLLGSYAGFSVNYLFGEGARPRYGLGFSWTTSAAILFFFFLLCYLYLRKEAMHWWEFVLLEAVNVYLFVMTDSRMAFVLSTAFLVFFFVETLRPRRWKMLFRCRTLLVLLPVLFALAAIAVSFLYQPGTPGWSELDDFLHNRLFYCNRALHTYGVSLFGTPIEWNGYDINHLQIDSYMYVDCSYMQILLNCGIVPLCACVAVYCVGVWRSLRKRDGYLACIYVIIAIFSMTEPRYMNLAFNLFPVLAFARLCRHPSYYKKGKRKDLLAETRNRHMQTKKAEDSSAQEVKPFRTSSIKFNYLMNALLSVSTFIFPLITFPYISRVLGPDGTGVVQWAFSIVGYFCIVSQLGIPTYGIRAIAKVRDNREELSRVTHELFLINLATTILSYILLAIALVIVPQMREEKTLFLIVGLTIILSAIGMEWLYRGLEQYRFITVRTLIFKTIAAVAMFLLIRSRQDYLIYGAITVFSGSASLILNFIHARHYVSFRWLGSYCFKRHLRPTLIFFALACATTVYTNLDIGMLGFIQGDTETGLYNAAVKVKSIVLGIITSLGAVLLPRAAYYLEQGMEKEFIYLGRKSLNFVCLLAAPVCVYFIIFAREGVLLLSGLQYEGAILPMQVIMPTVLLIGLSNVLGFQILTPMNRENVVLWTVCAGAVVDIILNILLIPRLASTGAAIGTLAAEFTVLLLQLLFLRRQLGTLFGDIKYLKIMVSILIAVVLTLWVKVLPLNNFWRILISVLVFFGIYYLSLMAAREPFVRDLTVQLVHRWKKTEKESDV